MSGSVVLIRRVGIFLRFKNIACENSCARNIEDHARSAAQPRLLEGSGSGCPETATPSAPPDA
jgi:hypothetical protein